MATMHTGCGREVHHGGCTCREDAEIAALKAEVAEQTARAEKAKAERDAARASEASIRASAIRHDDANNETIRVLTKKHDQALAACAEMRAALALVNQRRVLFGEPEQRAIDDCLSRTDLGAGMVLVPREMVGSIVDNCELLTNDIRTDPDFAPLRASVARLAALLKQGGG